MDLREFLHAHQQLRNAHQRIPAGTERLLFTQQVAQISQSRVDTFNERFLVLVSLTVVLLCFIVKCCDLMNFLRDRRAYRMPRRRPRARRRNTIQVWRMDLDFVCR